MKRNDTQFHEMVAKLMAGQINRKQAAAEYGVPYNTLAVWLKRSNVQLPPTTSQIPPASAPFVARPAKECFAAVDQAKADAMNAAVARVLAGEISALGASKEHPELGLSCKTIATKVRHIRISQGLPVQVRSSRYSKAPYKAPPTLTNPASEPNMTP